MRKNKWLERYSADKHDCLVFLVSEKIEQYLWDVLGRKNYIKGIEITSVGKYTEFYRNGKRVVEVDMVVSAYITTDIKKYLQHIYVEVKSSSKKSLIKTGINQLKKVYECLPFEMLANSKFVICYPKHNGTFESAVRSLILFEIDPKKSDNEIMAMLRGYERQLYGKKR